MSAHPEILLERHDQLDLTLYRRIAFERAPISLSPALLDTVQHSRDALVAHLAARGVLPLFLALFVGMIAICAYITTQTRFGVHLYAVGGSRQAANRAGISPRKMLLSAFAINGFFAAAAIASG